MASFFEKLQLVVNKTRTGELNFRVNTKFFRFELKQNTNNCSEDMKRLTIKEVCKIDEF